MAKQLMKKKVSFTNCGKVCTKKITCDYALYGYYDSTNLMGIVDETRNSKVIINLFAYPDSQGTGFPQNRKPQL